MSLKEGNNKEFRVTQHEEQENYSSSQCHFPKIKDWHRKLLEYCGSLLCYRGLVTGLNSGPDMKNLLASIAYQNSISHITSQKSNTNDFLKL